MKNLILPGTDTKLLDKRFEEEDASAQRQSEFAQNYTMGSPPEAQLVMNVAKGTMGVAVKGARFVCELPKGYEGAGLELAVIDGGRLIATHPNHSPLLIDAQQGTTRRL